MFPVLHSSLLFYFWSFVIFPLQNELLKRCVKVHPRYKKGWTSAEVLGLAGLGSSSDVGLRDHKKTSYRLAKAADSGPSTPPRLVGHVIILAGFSFPLIRVNAS